VPFSVHKDFLEVVTSMFISLFQLKSLKTIGHRRYTLMSLCGLTLLCGAAPPLLAQTKISSPRSTATAAPVVRLGLLDETKLAQARSDFPTLAARVLPQVIAKRQLALVVTKQGMRFDGAKIPTSDVTGDVLLLLKGWPVTAGALTGEQRAAAKKALDTLDALGVVLKVGNPSYSTYNERLTDTSIVFESSVKGVPDGALKTQLRQAMQSFLDVRTAWDTSIEAIKKGNQLIGMRYEIMRAFVAPGAKLDAASTRQQLAKMEREEAEERDKLQTDSLKPLAATQQKVFNELEAAEKLLPSLPNP
jgi:hypothetical protein